MQGHEVTVVDNFFTGRKKNVEHWIGHENFELIHADIVNPLYIEGKKWLRHVGVSLSNYITWPWGRASASQSWGPEFDVNFVDGTK